MESLRQSSHDRFLIAEQADAGALRRAVSSYTERLHVPPSRRGRAELVATELATNLIRHADGARCVLARPIPPSSVELIAVDAGPGIKDVPAAIDGRTRTRSGLGRGLAAVCRMSSHFDLFSEPGYGTTVLAVVDLGQPTARYRAPAPRSWAGVSLGVTEPCGDGWAVAELDRERVVVLVDGLGHGARASLAADAALSALTAFARGPGHLDQFLDEADEAMRDTRGAAVAVCRLRPEREELQHLAVGNVSGRIIDGDHERGLPFRNGTLGLRTPYGPRSARRRVAATHHPWRPGALLLLWSDGLRSSIDLSAHPALLTHDPAVIAATLHRTHSRERDDATVVVVRNTVTS